VVGCSLKEREREEEEEKGIKMPMGSEVGHKPTTPTTGVPVYVDGKNGWTSPSGRIGKGEYLLLVDCHGVSMRIERKRVSLTPMPPPKPEEQPIWVGQVA